MGEHDTDERGRRARWLGALGRLVPGLVAAAVLAVPTTAGVRLLSARSEPAPAVARPDAGIFGPGGLPGWDEDEVDVEEFAEPEALDAVPVGPEEVADPVRDVLAGPEVIEALDGSGIPGVARQAYDRAADAQAQADPSCRLGWSLLAAIGRVESDHGRFGGAQLREDGYGTRPIRGIPLDGRPDVALIRDTDGGRLDGDTTFDRAVGPMQIIPTTWRTIQADGNGDGRADPNNIYDAARGAASYLCAGADDLSTRDGRARAARRYNNADEYVRVVLNLATMYETGDLGAVEDAIAEADASDDGWDDVARPDFGFDLEPGPGPDPGPAPDPPAPADPPPAPDAAPAPGPPPPAPAPPAAVGWAPAMRTVVVVIIRERTPPPATTAPATTSTTKATTTTTIAATPPAPCDGGRGPVPTRPAAKATTTTGSAGAACPAPSTAPPAGRVSGR